MKRCTWKGCGSYAFNLQKENIEQGELCDRHYWQVRCLATHADAERYRWLKKCKNLTLRADDSIWTKPNGVKFANAYYLAEGGTQHAAAESLDELIDKATRRSV